MGDKDRNRGSVDRRTVLAAAGLGVGVVAVGGIGYIASSGNNDGAQTAHSPDEPNVPGANQEVRSLFGDLADGANLDRWTIRRVHGVYMGAIPVVLATADGKSFQVDVLRRDPNGPQGVGNTESLSVYVSNTGDGSTKTDEDQGLGAMALAAALGKREREGAAVPKLMTLKERHEAYPKGGYSVPV